MDKFDVAMIIMGLAALLVQVAIVGGIFYLAWYLITALVG